MGPGAGSTTAGDSAVMYLGEWPGCQSVWELHPCSISGLWAVVFFPFVYFFLLLCCCFFSPSFLPRLLIPPSLTVAFLQGVAQDFMLSCNHRLTLPLSPVISMWLKSPAATLQPLPLPVSLSRGSASLLYFCCRSFLHLLLLFLGGVLSILCIPLFV